MKGLDVAAPRSLVPRRGGSARGAGRIALLAVAAIVVVIACVITAVVRHRAAPPAPAPPYPPEATGAGTPATTPPRATAAPLFTDATAESGIDFVHRNGASGQYYLCEIMSGGGAFLDYDNDGVLDAFFVQGGEVGKPDPAVTSKLYHGEGGGRFRDVTARSGADLVGYGMGCAAADYDGDGFVDLYVTRVGPDVLLHSNGDGTYRDVTQQAGLGDDAYASSAAWLDYDRDGTLDLYVARYIKFVPELETACRSFGARDYCNPTSYPMPAHLLYRGLGHGRFEDVSASSGIQLVPGYGLAVTCSDFDGDGWTDIYVANDQSPALLWRNQHDGTFKDDALLMGAAYDGDGVAIAGMGIASEDFDGDGDLDLFVTNITQHSALFLRREGATFVDGGAEWGERRWMTRHTGFGVAALDADLDGRLEMLIANGAVMRRGETLAPGQPYAEPNVLVRQDATGRFVDASAELPPSATVPAVSRGVAFGDVDNDGDVDLLVLRNDASPLLLRNDQHSGNHWLTVVTQDARGRGPVLNAHVTVEAGGRRILREVRPHESYLTTSDPRVSFGLGKATSVERVVIAWPDGTREAWSGVATDQFFTARRGTGRAEPAP